MRDARRLVVHPPEPGKATIRGIGFFDFLHGQTGVAPNGIELYPVLRFMNATCEVVS